MNLSEYQYYAMETCLPTSQNVSYMLLGLTEEVGELCGKVSKAVRKGQVTIEGNALWSHMEDDAYQEWEDAVVKEGGDVLWMLSGLFAVLGVDLDLVASENLRKLASRRQRGVIDGAGDNR